MSHPSRELRADLIAIYQSALAACDAGHLLERRLRRDPPRGPLFLLGLGKPLATMALTARSVLGPQLEQALVVVPEAPSEASPQVPVLPGGARLEFSVGSHPYPDGRSATAGTRLLAAAAAIPTGANVLVLLAGGGSALAAVPVEGLSVQDKISAHRNLLRAGLPIQIVNGVRAHLSRIKGGGLLRALARSPAMTHDSERQPAPRIQVEILSDVGDGELDSVASGPCSPDRSTFLDCLDAVGTLGGFPEPALRYLQEGERGLHSETLKAGDPLLRTVATHLLAGPRDLLAAAVDAARARGLSVETEEHPWQIDIAEALARLERWLAGPSTASLFAAVGEVHLSLPTRPGIGGRAQQLVLAMAPVLARHGATLLAAGSDGRDGVSPFAGAVAGSDLELQAERSNLDIRAAVARCDASSVISALGLGLPATLPTSNLTDLVLLARRA